MGLRIDIQTDVAKAFDTDLADAVKSFTYRSIVSTFDENTNTTSEVTTDYTSRGVFTKFTKERLRDNSILDTDVKVIILQNEINVEPVQHNLIIQGLKEYTIEKVKQDPADVTWVLQCRL